MLDAESQKSMISCNCYPDGTAFQEYWTIIPAKLCCHPYSCHGLYHVFHMDEQLGSLHDHQIHFSWWSFAKLVHNSHFVTASDWLRQLPKSITPADWLQWLLWSIRHNKQWREETQNMLQLQREHAHNTLLPVAEQQGLSTLAILITIHQQTCCCGCDLGNVAGVHAAWCLVRWQYSKTSPRGTEERKKRGGEDIRQIRILLVNYINSNIHEH